MLPAGQDIPSPTKNPSRDQIQHTGRRPSLLRRSTDVAELNRIRSKEQTQLLSLATAPCLAMCFSLKICSNEYFFVLETRRQPPVSSGARSFFFVRLVDGCSSALLSSPGGVFRGTLICSEQFRDAIMFYSTKWSLMSAAIRLSAISI